MGEWCTEKSGLEDIHVDGMKLGKLNGPTDEHCDIKAYILDRLCLHTLNMQASQTRHQTTLTITIIYSWHFTLPSQSITSFLLGDEKTKAS